MAAGSHRVCRPAALQTVQPRMAGPDGPPLMPTDLRPAGLGRAALPAPRVASTELAILRAVHGVPSAIATRAESAIGAK